MVIKLNLLLGPGKPNGGQKIKWKKTYKSENKNVSAQRDQALTQQH